jgi:hypothetical protein
MYYDNNRIGRRILFNLLFGSVIIAIVAIAPEPVMSIFSRLIRRTV